jgi:hypothetical protein
MKALVLAAAALLSVGPLPAQMAAQMPMSPASAPAAASTTLTVVNGAQQVQLDSAALDAMPQSSVTVHNPHTDADETYTGVPLIEVLAKVGAPAGKQVHGQVLSQYVVAVGADNYKAVIALAEAEPDFHPGVILVADKRNGKPLDAAAGPFKLVVGEDKRPARSVHNLVKLELEQAQ